jgi:hypothetical protein
VTNEVVASMREQAEKILTAEMPLEDWARQCHAAALLLVQNRIALPARVARGSCKGVAGQHSWVVLGENVYDKKAWIIDPTLWSQSDEWFEKLGGPHVWIGKAKDNFHRPHGSGNIFDFGRPPRAHELGEEPLELTPPKPWSPWAQAFLNQIGPLSKDGWIKLAHYPMEGWPSGEIIEAMCENDLEGYVPIDIVGMVTNRNPKGLYLP